MDYGTASPAILLFADDEAGGARVADAAGAAGLTIAARGSIAEAAALLDARITQPPIVMVADKASEALADLLGRLDGAGVALLALDLVDLGWALAPEATLLCEPTDGELAAALAALAESERPASLHEEQRSPSLRQLSEEVGRIARALETLSEAPPPAAPPRPESLTAETIRAVLRARRLRDRFFDAGLFADPAWDMLLDLMAARLEGGQVAVSSLCIAAAVPTTTALRWTKVLTDAGLLLRVPDPQDGRRCFMALADRVADAITAYFAELQRQGLPGA